MGKWFFDESIHSKGNFIVGAFVYTALDPQSRISEELGSVGFTPGIDEFKSSGYFSRDPRLGKVRDGLRFVLKELGKIALIILPFDKRASVGEESLVALKTFLDTNDCIGDEHHEVYLDQGLFSSEAAALKLGMNLNLMGSCALFPESNSKIVLGIQLADLVAHTASMMLLEELGLIDKKVKAGDNSGYDPDLDLNIGFELYAGLRYNFFCVGPPPFDEWKSELDYQVTVEPYGLYISPQCDDVLAAHARSRFSKIYIGCVH